MIIIVNYEYSSKSPLLDKLIKVLGSPDKILLITSNYVGPYPGTAKDWPIGQGPLNNAILYFLKQLKMSYHILRNRRETSWSLFFIGGSVLVLPMISSRIVGRKIALMATGSASKSYRHMRGGANRVNSVVLSTLEKINYSLCDRLIVEAESVINFLELQEYQEKIVVASLSVDKQFSRTVPYNERSNTIGFIGRLSQEKGIRQFVEAIPLMVDLSLTFTIVGDGEERPWIEGFVKDKGLNGRVCLTGNINTSEVIKIMNSLKLLILPSFSEGLPNVVLEAMACGTPVLATDVGGIPDVIEDGINGFLIENNKPEKISMAIRKLMARDDLAEISINAERFINNHYSIEPVQKKWEDLLKF